MNMADVENLLFVSDWLNWFRSNACLALPFWAGVLYFASSCLNKEYQCFEAKIPILAASRFLLGEISTENESLAGEILPAQHSIKQTNADNGIVPLLLTLFM